MACPERRLTHSDSGNCGSIGELRRDAFAALKSREIFSSIDCVAASDGKRDDGLVSLRDPREVTDVDFGSRGLGVIRLRRLGPASLSRSANVLFVVLFIGISSDISVTGSCWVNSW